MNCEKCEHLSALIRGGMSVNQSVVEKMLEAKTRSAERDAYLYYVGYLRGFQDVSNQLTGEELQVLERLEPGESGFWVYEDDSLCPIAKFWRYVKNKYPDFDIPEAYK